jgi:DNA-binding NarL/FixJ family response regulator
MQHALIVEDLPDIRHWLVQTLLQAYPLIHITTAARRIEALEIVQKQSFELALIDLGLPDGSGVDVVGALKVLQPEALSVVVTIHADDGHVFPALQAGAFGYLLKEQPREEIVAQLLRITQGEPPLSASIARRVLQYFSMAAADRQRVFAQIEEAVKLTERETEVLQRVAKGFTLQEIADQFELSRFTINDYVKAIYRKLNVSSRAQAALEAVRRGLVKP